MFERELEIARWTARAAGEILLRHYEAGTAAARMKDDASPVTDADLEANRLIVERLHAAFPDDALLTEEQADDGQRLQASRVWIIDPMDGTRDFVARTGDFCVHIGLAVDGRAVVGAVSQPVADRLCFAVAGGGAHLEHAGTIRRIAVSNRRALGELRFGISRFEATRSLQRFAVETEPGRRAVKMGASTKLLAIAEGTLDAVMCVHQDEKEWDTCAPEVIVREAGGMMTDLDGKPLSYNGRELRHLRGSLASNGQAHDEIVRLAAPYAPPAALSRDFTTTEIDR